MFDDYREIPLKTFLKVLSDEKRLKDLLPSVSVELWNKFKTKFEEDNPSPNDEVRIEKQQNFLYPDSKIQLYKTLIHFSLISYNSWEKFFDAVGVTKKANLIDSIAYVNKMIAKEQVRFNVAHAEFKKFNEDYPVEQSEESDYNVFDALSSLSAVTGNKLDYNTATIGELMAEQKLAQRIAEKNNKNG